MLLTVLGCRAGMPAAGQPSSGYLVDTGSTRLLLDCGPGVATALSAVASPGGVDAVIISHLHLDHCYDLLPLGKSLLGPLVTYPGGSSHGAPSVNPDYRRTPLYLPEGTAGLLERWAALFPVRTMPLLDRAFEVAFDVREYRPGDRFAVGDSKVSLHGLRHVEPNCGVRVECDGGSLAYTGDTGVTPALLELSASVDILLAEASLRETDHGPHGHLSGADAGRVAASANAAQLVLTHFSSTDPEWLDTLRLDAAEHYDGPVHVALPGRCFAAARGDVPVATALV